MQGRQRAQSGPAVLFIWPSGAASAIRDAGQTFLPSVSQLALYSKDLGRLLGFYPIEDLLAEHRSGDIVFHYDETRKGKKRHQPTHAERVFTDARRLVSAKLPIAEANRTVFREHPEGADAAPVKWWSHKPVYEGALA